MSPPPPCPARPSLAGTIRQHLLTPYAPPLYLYGAPSTGKRTTLGTALPAPDAIVDIDCVLCPTDRQLYGAATRSSACDPSSLVMRLASTAAIATLVFHRAERLATAFPPSTAALLLSLPTLANRPDLHVVLLSIIPWQVFRRSLTLAQEPVSLFFPPYTPKEATDFIVNTYPVQPDDRAPLANFAASVVETLLPATNHLPELRAVTHTLFPAYLSALRTAPSSNAAVAAFNAVHPRLHSALRALYRRDTSEAHPQPRAKELPERRIASWGLSTASLTLLVAAFLAARNPPAHDIRYFTTERTRRARGRGRGRGHGSGRGRAYGRTAGGAPALFPLERLLAIFTAIRDDDAVPLGAYSGDSCSVTAATSTATLVQLSSLVSLNYLSKDGGADTLSEPRFRCNLSPQQAADIAPLVGVELDLYLHTDPHVM